MKPSELTSALKICVRLRQPVFVWGSPGIGKSQIVHQVGKNLNLEVRDVRAVLLDPVDLRGLPTVQDGQSKWSQPDFLPREGNGILFLDELNRAPALVQNACFQLILDRKLGDYTLPDGWSIVAAGNNSGTGTTKISDALANRFVHLDAEVDLADWCKWAITANIEPVVIAFMRFRSPLLHSYDQKTAPKAFPSPRSWEFVSRIVAADTKTKTSEAIELSLIKGTIGDGPATEFYSFVKIYSELPSIDAILLNPTKAQVPNSTSTLYAVASALAHRMKEENIGRAIAYLNRLPQEFAVFAVNDAVTRDKKLQQTKEFIKWATDNQEVI